MFLRFSLGFPHVFLRFSLGFPGESPAENPNDRRPGGFPEEKMCPAGALRTENVLPRTLKLANNCPAAAAKSVHGERENHWNFSSGIHPQKSEFT